MRQARQYFNYNVMEKERYNNPLFTLTIGEFIEVIKDVNKELYREMLAEIVKPPEKEKELLTIGEASELLMLSKSTLYQLNIRGKIPYFKKGKRVIYKRSELLDWLNQGKRMTKEEAMKIAENDLADVYRKRHLRR